MNFAEVFMLLALPTWLLGEVVFAVILHRGRTTTFYVRKYTKGHAARQVALVLFAVWFVGHMLAGWPP